jgi:hypothetical protein
MWQNESQINKICSYCNQHEPWVILLPRTVYYNHGFSQRDVLQCRECQKEEMDLFNLTLSITPITWHNEAYESICEMINIICSKQESKSKPEIKSKVVNYYDAVKRAYEKEAMKILDQNNPMTIRDYLLARGVNSVNKIDKNLKALWEFTFRIVNNNEERIKVVNKDPDNMLVSWIDI